MEKSPAPARANRLATFEAVTRRFGDVTALDALTLDLECGQTVALLGPNGAGKTTTVDLQAGPRPWARNRSRTSASSSTEPS